MNFHQIQFLYIIFTSLDHKYSLSHWKLAHFRIKNIFPIQHHFHKHTQHKPNLMLFTCTTTFKIKFQHDVRYNLLTEKHLRKRIYTYVVHTYIHCNIRDEKIWCISKIYLFTIKITTSCVWMMMFFSWKMLLKLMFFI